MARILLAEDDSAIRDFVRLALEMDKHEVVSAHDGAEAYERLIADINAYDLLLTDIKMPVTDGLTLVQQIVSLKIDLPVLVMTGFQADYEIDQLKHEQVRGIVTKPFTLERIRDEITSILEQSSKIKAAAPY